MIDSCIANPLLDWGAGEVVIPDLDGGLLPFGIFDCTFKEMKERYGYNRHRAEQTRKLMDYVTLLRKYGASGWIMVNGSYVTSKDSPGDIDIIVVMNKAAMRYQTAEDRCAMLYLYQPDIAKTFGLEAFAGYGDTPSETGFVNEVQWVTDYTEAFTTVLETGERKGILRIEL